MKLYEAKQKMAEVSEHLRDVAAKVAAMAGDPTAKMEDITKSVTERDELQKRLEIIKSEHDRLERASREEVQTKAREVNDPEQDKIKAKAAFYKAAFLDAGNAAKAYSGMGAIPAQDAELGHGDNLLPTNMATELLTEPLETNSLRKVEPVSNVTGLEEPKMEFSLDDESLTDVTDKDTAKEIEMDSGMVTYGRFKTKIFATVKDTVLHGTVTNLVATIENALRSALAIKEKMRAFDQSPDATHAHMSFYSTANAIKTVKGENLLKAIINAYGDLPDFFAENAVCVMRRSDYVAMIETLSNGAESLFGKKPEEIIGIPVIFNDRAVIPVIGDFRYSKQNYDLGTMYETDKDGKKGEYYFILTAWGDHRIKLKSAFRLAVNGQVPTLERAEISGTPKVDDVLNVALTYSSGAPNPNLSFQWMMSATKTGTYADVEGAVYAQYTPTTDDIGKYLKVKVKAAGSATGERISDATSTAIIAAG